MSSQLVHMGTHACVCVFNWSHAHMLSCILWVWMWCEVNTNVNAINNSCESSKIALPLTLTHTYTSHTRDVWCDLNRDPHTHTRTPRNVQSTPLFIWGKIHCSQCYLSLSPTNKYSCVAKEEKKKASAVVHAPDIHKFVVAKISRLLFIRTEIKSSQLHIVYLRESNVRL